MIEAEKVERKSKSAERPSQSAEPAEEEDEEDERALFGVMIFSLVAVASSALTYTVMNRYQA